MSTRIPSSWVESTFSELNQFESSTTNPAQHPQEEFELYSVPIFPTGKPELLKGAAIGSTKQTVEQNDVLVCKINPRINRVWQVGGKQKFRQIASSEWIGFRSNVLNLKFYKHYFTSASFRELICTDLTGVGGSLTRAQPKKVATFPMPLAPLDEQKRIADKLDVVLAQVDACRDRLDRIPAILKRFRQSVLAAATSGKLTADWRNQLGESMCSVKVTDPYSHTVVAPDSWRKTSFGEVCDLIGGSQPPKSTFVHDESDDVVRLIQIRDYKSDKFKVFIPRKLARRFCNKTEVMIGRYGPPIFQILRGLEGAYNVALMKAEPKIEELELDYLFYWLKGETLLRYVESGSERTAGQDGIRKELLNVYPFFLPPKDEQTEIVRRVETLFACADRLVARHTTARAQVEKLTPATLAKAFRGELVPQDPNDEPASALLERIKAHRSNQAAINPKRSRKAMA